jgi:hypothetical protein
MRNHRGEICLNKRVFSSSNFFEKWPVFQIIDQHASFCRQEFNDLKNLENSQEIVEFYNTGLNSKVGIFFNLHLQLISKQWVIGIMVTVLATYITPACSFVLFVGCLLLGDSAREDTANNETLKCNPKQTKNLNLLAPTGSQTRDTCHKIETHVIKSRYDPMTWLVRS